MIVPDADTISLMAIVRRAARLGYDPWRIGLALNLDRGLIQIAIDSAQTVETAMVSPQSSLSVKDRDAFNASVASERH